MRRMSLSIRYRNSRARLAATRTRPPASPDRELTAIARLSKRRYCSKRDSPCKLFDNAYLLVSSKYLSAFLLLLTTCIPYWPTAQQRRRSQLVVTSSRAVRAALLVLATHAGAQFQERAP